MPSSVGIVENTAVEDESAFVDDIYEAVGDVERWRRIEDRLAGAHDLSPETEHHLEVARHAHQQYLALAGSIAVLAGVHDQVAVGALVVDSTGTLLQANTAAKRVLVQDLGLTIREGRVVAKSREEHDALAAAIARESTRPAASTSFDETFVLIARLGKPPLCVFVLRSEQGVRSFFDDRSVVVLLLIDPDCLPTSAADVLRELFGFTPREAELAALLIEGYGVADAAKTLGVRLTTVRTFLARLTAKTDTNSQVELVRRLLAIPPVVS